jgi:hypothetical protein
LERLDFSSRENPRDNEEGRTGSEGTHIRVPGMEKSEVRGWINGLFHAQRCSLCERVRGRINGVLRMRLLLLLKSFHVSKPDVGSLSIETCNSSHVTPTLHSKNQEKFIYKLLNLEADINSVEERR